MATPGVGRTLDPVADLPLVVSLAVLGLSGFDPLMDMAEGLGFPGLSERSVPTGLLVSESFERSEDLVDLGTFDVAGGSAPLLTELVLIEEGVGFGGRDGRV